MSIKGKYPLLEPKMKYPKAFCTDEDLTIVEEIRKFVDKEIMAGDTRQKLEGGWHRDEELAHKTLYELYYKCHEMGLTIANLPKEYGGSGLSPLVRMMIAEEISRGDIGLATLIGKIHWIVSFMANRVLVRKDLLEEFAPKLTGKVPYIACVCITEPAGGANIEDPSFDFRTIQTIAKLEKEKWVINGSKIWPGPGGDYKYFKHWADKWPHLIKGHLGYWTIVTSDPTKGGEAAGIIYSPPDVKNLSFSKPYEKCGFCWTDENVEMWYENVQVPKKYRIDIEPGQGAKIIKGYVIGLGRLVGAARLVGLATACLEAALEWTKNRFIAGKPVRDHSAFATIFAEMFRSIDIARQYYLTVGWTVTHPEIYGEPWSREMIARFSAARSFAGDAAMYATNKAMELMGSYGYAFDYPIEKYYRDFKIVQMWLGGAQRDRLDISYGLYGPFTWGGLEEWLKKEKLIAGEIKEKEKETKKILRKKLGNPEAKKEIKERKRDLDYSVDNAVKETRS
jgi:alkylation response protein AidB-like acyl-CoA dehydrogenase